MARALSGSRRLSLDTTFKLVAATLSAGAALASILTFVLNHRRATIAAAMAPESAEQAAGQPEVDRIAVAPAADTAWSLGDTMQLTAFPADARGMALQPGRVQWLADDSAVATVDSSGQVIARRPGMTTITVAAGGRAGRARVWVLPRVVALEIESDSVIEVNEGGSTRLTLAARDARGNRIGAEDLEWTVADREVAGIDSLGWLTGITPGNTLVSATASGLLTQQQVEVLPVPASLTLSGGGSQRGAAGSPLNLPVTVQVVSRSGRPVPSAPVLFHVPGSTAQVAPESTLTDATGKASAHWSLDAVPGRQRLSVRVPGVDSPLVVTAEADPLPGRTRIVVMSDSLRGVAGSLITEELTVRVSDSTGVVLADVPVAWETPDGGTLAATEARTDSAGRARARWTLGRKAGGQRARVQVGNPRSMPPLEIRAVAAPGPAVRLQALSGNSQRGIAGNPLAKPLVLQVADSLGNPVPGAVIQVAGAGTVADSSHVSDARGRVQLRWTLPPAVGASKLVARLGRRAEVELTATGVAGPPAAIALGGAPRTGNVGKPLPRPVSITVTDKHGNPVAGAAIRLTATSGRLSASRLTTDERGEASLRWTLGARAGRQTLTARDLKGGIRAAIAVEAKAPPPAKPRTSKTPAKTAPARRSPLGTSVP